MARPTTPRPVKPAPPYFRLEYEVSDVSALQALTRGDATPEQQKRAIDWIIRKAAMTYDLPFFPGEPDAGVFACGRQFVGKEIVTLLSVSTRDLLLREQRKQGD